MFSKMSPTITPLVTISSPDCSPAKQSRRPSLPATPKRPSLNLPYHLRTIYLFTCNDFKFIIYPNVAFAIACHLAAPAFDIAVAPTLGSFVRVLLFTALWSWFNLLPFDIDNQRHPTSIAEDRLNKPWRPIAAGRLTARQATNLMLATYPVVFTLGFCFSIFPLTLILTALGILHNTFGGGDWDPVTRNFLNAAEYFCYNAGAAKIALQTDVYDAPILTQWTTAVAAIVMTTIQLQDLYDQRGDAANGRKTLPLIAGDGSARWITATPMAFWSLFCPWYWNLPLAGLLTCAGLGLTVASRTLCYRTEKDDKNTMKLWTVWLMVVYLLPLIKHVSESMGI